MHQVIMTGAGQANQCMETLHSFQGINVTLLERMHQCNMYIL